MAGFQDLRATLQALLPDVIRTIWTYSAAGLLGYLVGSLNPASMIARARGADLRGRGSGNPGATNAGRVMGWRVGVLVGLLDVAKGYLPVLLVALVAGAGPARVAGLAAVVGHITSPWLRGRGGKGVATALGAILAVHPLWVLPVIAVFGIVVAVSRNVGLASVCGALVLVPTALLLPSDGLDLFFALALCVIVCVRHVENLRRTFTGLVARPGRRAGGDPQDRDVHRRAQGGA